MNAPISRMKIKRHLDATRVLYINEYGSGRTPQAYSARPGNAGGLSTETPGPERTDREASR